MAFGGWLVRQAGRDDWIGALGAMAAADAGFPAGADPESVRVRLAELEADPDCFEQLDDAELEWLAGGRQWAA